MSAPTPEEAKLIIEFRTKVKPILKTEEQTEDAFLIRWLRASNLNLKKAEDNLKTSLLWREKNDVDNLTRLTVDPLFIEAFPFYIDGFDKGDRPVMFMPIGKWEFRKVNLGNAEDFTKFTIYLYEQCLQTMREKNAKRDPDLFPITQLTAIVDFTGLSFMQLTNPKVVRAMIQLPLIYEAHYPEILFQCFFINCPVFINAVLTILKPVLAPKSMSKININGSDRNKWELVIKEEIDDDQLSFILKRLVNNKK